MKWLHKWLSLILGIILMLWAISGILLNHRELISRLSLGRQYLPKAYQLRNWNNASVRASLEIDSLNNLIYGNIGIWKTDSKLQHFSPWMEGLPKGTDPIRTMRVVKQSNGIFYAATQSGLYFRADTLNGWQKIRLPAHDERIQDIALKGDSVLALDRSRVYLFTNPMQPTQFQVVNLLPSTDDDNKISLFLTLWFIHSGEIFGNAGKFAVDFFALVLIFLILTGYAYFLFPHRIKHLRKKSQQTKNWASVFRFSGKWHQKIGIWLGIFLFFTALTGSFLRPPLLIPIAHSRVNKIPYSTLDRPNSWTDRLRNLVWDEAGDRWLLGTNDGIFSLDRHLAEKAQRLTDIPPISVMGINVFEADDENTFLIGSFNGLFYWQPQSGRVIDYFTGEAPSSQANVSKPISSNMISGIAHLNGQKLIFDYNRGLINAEVNMPEVIRNQALPLWNFALEIHTGRIVQDYIGPFYILMVPLMGISALLILVSGAVRWYRRRKRQKITKALP